MQLFWVMIHLWFCQHMLPTWMPDQTHDSRLPYKRRLTHLYQKRKMLVKKIWLGASLIVLISPVLHILLIVILPATFLSFAILDETR